MKTRFESFDVIAIVSELRRCIVGQRLVNVYDTNSKTYLLKLSGSLEEKPVLLIESGVRMHLTSFSWPKNTMPLGFTMKLRKHIKNKRISDIQQLGVDRMVDITFGFDERAFHLIIELYGKGNMFLTDAEYTILHLLRSRTDVDQDVRYVTREVFPIELARPIPECLIDLKDACSYDKLVKIINEKLIDSNGPWNCDKCALPPPVSVLSNVFSYGSGLLEHCCFLAGLRGKNGCKLETSSSLPVDPESLCLEISKGIATALRDVLLQVQEGKQSNENGSSNASAIILGTLNPHDTVKPLRYESYYPLRFAHLTSKPGLEFESFNKAVDEFYSFFEIQRNEAQVVQSEKSANKRLENIKRDQAQRLQALKEEQTLDNLKATLLELNMDLVDRVIFFINSAIASQTNWKVLEAVLARQKEEEDNHEIANCIQSLQLESNQAVVRLVDPYEDPKEAISLDVLIDLDSTALQNAQKYYTHKRQAELKEQKTIAGSKKALKTAVRKADKIKKDLHGAPKLAKNRKQYWFEKFHWFISSDNYLVLAGRDAGQNENLVRRYFRQHDIYVHADIHGASSVIVKARPLRVFEKPVASDFADDAEAGSVLLQPPLRTLLEAGQMAVALSNAWSAKVVTNAWWVRYEQVSKTAPSGEYLSTGSFVIRGRKNILPLCHLSYGIGILFRLSDDSVERHQGERCIDLEATMAAEEAVKRYEVEPLAGGDESDDGTDDVARAFNDVTLDLNINRKPHQQECQNIPNHQKQQHKHLTTAKSTKPEQYNEKQPVKAGTNALKRGQRAKMKRIKQKYADQDEEERQIRLQILQGAKAKLSAVHDIFQSSVEKSAEEENGEFTEVESGPSKAKKDEQQKETRDGMAPFDARVRDSESESLANDAMFISTLDTLTGLPEADDTFLFALPFCAPFSALEKFKYKAKLVPGTQKRGKITKLAIHHFITDKTASESEKQLIQAIREEDVCRVLPGPAKITFPVPPFKLESAM